MMTRQSDSYGNSEPIFPARATCDNRTRHALTPGSTELHYIHLSQWVATLHKSSQIPNLRKDKYERKQVPLKHPRIVTSS